MTVWAIHIAEQTLTTSELNTNHEKIVASAPFQKAVSTIAFKKIVIADRAFEGFIA